MNFLDKIDVFCQEHNITASRFEREAGLSKGQISKWKHKGFNPGYESQKKIAAYMGISTLDLMRVTPVDPYSSADNLTGSADIVRDSAVRYIPVYRDMPDFSDPDPALLLTHLTALPEDLESTDDCFGLKICDSSMEPELHPEDIVIVKKDLDPENGDIVIVSSPGTPTVCRKLVRSGSDIILQPCNMHYDSTLYRKEELELLPVMFIGKVIKIVRNVRSSSHSISEK